MRSDDQLYILFYQGVFWQRSVAHFLEFVITAPTNILGHINWLFLAIYLFAIELDYYFHIAEATSYSLLLLTYPTSLCPLNFVDASWFGCPICKI
jgi:hypothetical protein